MNSLVIYDSLYGNTKQIAEAIADILKEYGQVRFVQANEANLADFEDIDFLAIGGPTQGHGVSQVMRNFLDDIPEQSLPGIPAIAFDTRFQKPQWLTGAASIGIAKKLESLGCDMLLPHESFFVVTGEGPLEEGELERAVAWARQAISITGESKLVPAGV